MSVGVLALQGGFREHCEALERLGVKAPQIRVPEQLDDIVALVIPGGESTAIGKLLRSSGLFETLRTRDLPVMGTCAGMILSARDVTDGIDDQVSLGIFDATVRRNAIGSQRHSHEAQIEINGFTSPFTGIFIRPPVVEKVGDSVEILSALNGDPVLAAQDRHVFATFHPELSGDDRIHRLFLERLS